MVIPEENMILSEERHNQPVYMRIHAHGREQRRPRTRVHLTDNFGHKYPKPWAKLGKALGKVVHCGLVTFPDFSRHFFTL